MWIAQRCARSTAASSSRASLVSFLMVLFCMVLIVDQICGVDGVGGCDGGGQLGSHLFFVNDWWQ